MTLSRVMGILDGFSNFELLHLHWLVLDCLLETRLMSVLELIACITPRALCLRLPTF